jgi:hypothetical protein
MGKTVSQRQLLARKLEALNESEVCEVLDYISMMESSHRAKPAPSTGAPSTGEDEVLTALADARENRRARQAFEWEIVRRKAEKRAAAKVYLQV